MMKQILVVDDNWIVRLALGRVLSHHGFAVLQASSAELALEFLADGFDANVIITDFWMGPLAAMTGADLLRRVRSEWPAIKVILLSGLGERSYGFDAVLAKPAENDLVIRTVQSLLGESKP